MRIASLIIGCFLLGGFGTSTVNPGFDFETFKSYYHLNDSSNTEALKGKVVLIEFWASWCQPCRVRNGELNKTFTAFNDKGFEIISVALDTDSSTWRKAIRNDRLTWSLHAMDTAKWESAFLKKSKIYYLPNNVLLDANGNVIARELQGDRLNNEIRKATDHP